MGYTLAISHIVQVRAELLFNDSNSTKPRRRIYGRRQLIDLGPEDRNDSGSDTLELELNEDSERDPTDPDEQTDIVDDYDSGDNASDLYGGEEDAEKSCARKSNVSDDNTDTDNETESTGVQSAPQPSLSRTDHTRHADDSTGTMTSTPPAARKKRHQKLQSRADKKAAKLRRALYRMSEVENVDDLTRDNTTLQARLSGTIDTDEASLKGGKMEEKLDGTIRISSINKGGLRLNNIKSTLQHALDLEIDIKCYSKNNIDTLKGHVQQRLNDNVQAMDQQAKAIWNSGTIPTESEFKPGGTSVITFGKTAGRVKEQGKVLDGKGDTDILIISVYQCCKQPTKEIGMTAFHQQQMLLSELDRKDLDPHRNFLRDLKSFLR